MAVNILSFIYTDNESEDINKDIQHKYQINCFLGPSCCQRLYVDTVRSYIYSAYIEGIQNRQKMADPQDTIYCCDLCKVECSEYDYMYHCVSQMCSRHDICIVCISSYIHHRDKLFKVLKPMLKEELIEDCITLIMSFVL